MKFLKLFILTLLTVVLPLSLFAQNDANSRFTTLTSFTRPTFIPPQTSEHIIKGFIRFDDISGVVFTDGSIYRTTDAGAGWNKLNIRAGATRIITDVVFTDAERGYAVLSGVAGDMALQQTLDGGNNWTNVNFRLPQLDHIEGLASSAKLEVLNDKLMIDVRVQTSSNFLGTARYTSFDGGQNWQLEQRQVVANRDEESQAVKTSGNWTLTSDGVCVGNKTGCYQTTKLTINGKDANPGEVKAAELTEHSQAVAEASETPMFSTPPGGSTRISLHRGFDKCTAGTVAQMQTWWNTSWFHDANIYMSGRNRGCVQPQLTANWVKQVSAMGWGLIPTIVGYQSPCTVSTTSAKFSYDVAVAEQQGRGEADIAVADAINLGFAAGSILYYDMERYDETASTPGCRLASTAFLKGWTDRVKELNFVSGTYGSPKNAQEDWLTLPTASRMHAIWMARWDNVPNVWTYVSFPTFPTNEWDNHQRIKQWQAPHDETWGGVTFNIDGNISDGPVAGFTVPKNKNADFDGDQKADLSVFRPDTGVWYALRSSNGAFSAIAFGLATDIPTPGDFDGDGKTDIAVFRPDSGVWHFLLKGNNYSARSFGMAGDIPVPADYNGDGLTDIAVFRPSNGTWYIEYSDSRKTFVATQFGISEDRPVQADFDGDGKADIAVFRPSIAAWYVLRSSDGSFYNTTWGLAGDTPVRGDYDGDGKADFAVVREGHWIIRNSSGGQRSLLFGFPYDLPIPADYDGDGKDDLAVFRHGEGTWYLLQSANGFYGVQFGMNGDKPIPSAYHSY